MYIVVCYLAYLAISLSVTVWVAQTLQKSGRSFLVEAFHGNCELADSVNRLLVVGFYLINAGYVTRALHTADQVATARAAIELVSDKIGLVLLVLGAMHFLNLYIFNRLRKRARADLRPPFPADAQSSVTES
jgi:hypothetical protein